MANRTTTIIVTGANRGIGHAICQQLLQQTPAPLRLYAASRRGEDLHLEPADARSRVLYPSLDVTKHESISALAETVRSEAGTLDVLVNNAGVNLDRPYTLQNVRATMEVNYRGTLQMCQTFLPLLSHQGRIVNLSSVGSTLKNYSSGIQQRFRDPHLTLPSLEQLVRGFERAVENKSEQSSGFDSPGRAYNVSKACVNALTAVLARENPRVFINACCPGWVSTDMGKLVGKPPKTAEQGATIPVRLAVGDIGGVSGRYWANASIRSREAGEVREW